MIQGWTVALLAFGYVGALFALAWFGDRNIRALRSSGRPLIYALSLAVYCTSWTFFGSVGLASSTGYDFLAVYLGPIILFAFGWPLILRIVRIAKSQNITSVADFLAARYGKSPAVAALATAVLVAGSLPYMALQLKAVAVSIETLLGSGHLEGFAIAAGYRVDTALVIAIALAIFAIFFGTRHIDATEHQDGLMLAVAAESLVKLAAFLAIGTFVVFSLFGGPAEFLSRVRASDALRELFGGGLNGGFWLTVTILSLCCAILLPRQFHVTVVENYHESEVRRAAWLFPLYLVLINLFVLPIAAAGLLLKPDAPADMVVLALPMAVGAEWITILAFIGGLSAATAMVIVDGVALAIMICNGFVVPWLVRRQLVNGADGEDMTALLLRIRRVAIFVIVMLAYGVYRTLGQVHGLAQIGLVSFAAIAQLAPAFFGGLLWRRGTARGAIAGITLGFVVWAYTLLLPWTAMAGWLPLSFVENGPLGIGILKPQELLFLKFDPLQHGVLMSLLGNVFAYVFVSMLRLPQPIERMQAAIFVRDDLPRPPATPAFRLWRTQLTVADLQQTAGRYLGAERAERSFATYAATRNAPFLPQSEADVGTLRFTEHLLSSAIGAASARLVLSLLLKRGDVSNQTALKLLDDASEAIQYNRDLLQSALDQVRHGLSVFDRDMRLISWNRQFRELLQLPPDLGQVGMRLQDILKTIATRGDLGVGNTDQLVAACYMKLAVTHETFQQTISSTNRIVEIRTSPMPQGGVVTTYSDITDRVTAAAALERANETLERRVRERTADLLEVNQALAIAKTRADAASLDKTRFLAAASHDILQPLNAARLYASSLVERHPASDDARLARNIDVSLESVEEILGAILDISRFDAGHLEPDLQNFNLADLFDQLRVEFEPLARKKHLRIKLADTDLWVRTDRRLLRRVLQNLLSNAIKYTAHGGVLMGCRRRGANVVIQVHDSGPGIPEAQHALIFKEFHRLKETASAGPGLGLGLSIVERIGRVLGTPVNVRSNPGRGSTFSISLLRAPVGVRPLRSSQPAVPIGIDVAGSLVLCVDNERQVLEGMRSLLEGWACEVLLADDVASAIAAVSTASRKPDFIFADYHLNGATGLETIAAVRAAANAEIPAIIITADHSAEVQRIVRLSDCGLLRKPLKAAALRAMFGQYKLKYALTKSNAAE